MRKLIQWGGYEVVPMASVRPPSVFPSDFSPQDIEDYLFVKPYTLVPPERMYAQSRAIEYLIRNDIPGVFLECGTWKGGSSMAMARTLLRLGVTDRDLYLFDLFENNWPTPTIYDVSHGVSALKQVEEGYQVPEEDIYSLEDVQRNMRLTGYPEERIHYIKGRVSDTLPGQAPETVAFLRLDTDFYESTLHELVHLYPRLTSGGVLLIDDYGEWEGSQKATDEYMAEHNLPLCLIRTDCGGRMAIKP